MPFAAMIEGKLNFRPHAEGPFGQETDTFGRPLDLILNQIDRIRITNRYTCSLRRPCFSLNRHKLHLEGYVLLNI